jgi:hypothetical protein
MKIEDIEAKALADKKTEHEAYFPANKPGALMVVWDYAFEYYELSPRGEPVYIDRDEAIDLLNDIQFKAAKAAKAGA